MDRACFEEAQSLEIQEIKKTGGLSLKKSVALTNLNGLTLQLKGKSILSRLASVVRAWYGKLSSYRAFLTLADKNAFEIVLESELSKKKMADLTKQVSRRDKLLEVRVRVRVRVMLQEG